MFYKKISQIMAKCKKKLTGETFLRSLFKLSKFQPENRGSSPIILDKKELSMFSAYENLLLVLKNFSEKYSLKWNEKLTVLSSKNNLPWITDGFETFRICWQMICHIFIHWFGIQPANISHFDQICFLSI